MSMKELFLDLAKPNRRGFSRKVAVSEFKDKYHPLQLGNGGSWCREDGTLGRIYNIERGKIKGKGNVIVYVKLHGYKKAPILKPIPSWIRRALQNKRCVVLHTSGVEIDHKDGRRDDPRLTIISELKLDDFQPLSKSANNAKRQHCKKCRATNKRFDAKRLGFIKSQTMGNGTYRGTCVGCYWYDPVDFRKLI